MARETGKVTQIENGWMEVKVPTGNGCALCKGKSACTFRGPDSAYRHFKLPHQPGIQEGNRVSLEIRDAAQNLSAFILFGSPVILFLASYLLINYYFRIPNSEIWSVAVTAVLYGITLFLSNRWLSRLPMFQPRLTGVGNPETDNKFEEISLNSNHQTNANA
jgi:positive regulator of sigma E activity